MLAGMVLGLSLLAPLQTFGEISRTPEMASYCSSDTPMEITWLDSPDDMPRKGDFRLLWPGSMACVVYVMVWDPLNIHVFAYYLFRDGQSLD